MCTPNSQPDFSLGLRVETGRTTALAGRPWQGALVQDTTFSYQIQEVDMENKVDRWKVMGYQPGMIPQLVPRTAMAQILPAAVVRVEFE